MQLLGTVQGPPTTVNHHLRERSACYLPLMRLQAMALNEGLKFSMTKREQTNMLMQAKRWGIGILSRRNSDGTVTFWRVEKNGVAKGAKPA